MKHKSLIAFLVLVTLQSGGYVAVMKLTGQIGGYLAQAYMLIPALSALVTRIFFDERKFTDANLRLGHLKHYLQFWLFSLGITVLYFVSYTVLGAGQWDFTGNTFLANLSQQFAATGQDMNDTLPPGMTPQTMLLIFFIGGLTVFNILPGMITGFGEEFGWRGLMFPRLYEIHPWMAFVLGGLIWYAWHLPLALVVPQQVLPSPSEQAILIIPMVIGAICTFTYLAYVYVKTRSVFVAAFAHIVMNNASASLGYLFVLRNQLLANLGTVLVMVIVVALLHATGQLRIFKTFVPDKESVVEL
ncbi:MAG: CPBP family intramembrane metalloprotease [Anaerolineae bacterium]|nr:CPBP family intramembrane metalloprotease [Anaerolineae bacterium]